MAKVRIKKEDQVVVIAGKDRDLTKPRRVLQVMQCRPFWYISSGYSCISEAMQ